ncbi:MAG: nucleotidyl transferase AbiEii/AbiGii toxin family protein [Microgenomates group bacterium]
MLDFKTIKKLSIKHQTTIINIVREYIQHLFLSYFYQEKGSENFLFKGGTALRIIYNSPRFSADLDFTGIKNGKVYEQIVENVIVKLEKNGFKVKIEESKKTSGGWLAIFKIKAYELTFNIINEISYRKRASFEGDLVLVTSEFTPSYTVFLLDPEIMIEEKVNALLTRKKPRDFFDLYFILRDLRLRKFYNQKYNQKIIPLIKKTDENFLKKELEIFLPINFKPILKNLKIKILEAI